jgi:CHAT domain-containing protein
MVLEGTAVAVSRRVAYSWTCCGCGNAQEVPVWRILDSRERDLAVEPIQELAVAACPECGTLSEINAPLLLLRPGHVLSWLLALPLHEMGDPLPRIRELAREVSDVLGSDAARIFEPMVAVPRLLLPVVLARDVTADTADPGQAAQEVAGQWPAGSGYVYQKFLEMVRDSAPVRRLASALQRLWPVQPAELVGFLRDHPELGWSDAAAMVREEFARVPPGESDEPVRARLALVEGLASGRSPDDVAQEYLATLDQFGAQLLGQFDRLLAGLTAGSPDVLQVRHVRQMAIDLGRGEAEAALNAHLAALLLARPVTSADGIEEVIALLQRSLSLLPEDHPLWLVAAVNLSGAYRLRPVGDATEDWETQQRLMERVLEASDRETDASRWALAQTNYGLLLAERPGGGREDLTRGIEHIDAGLEERSAQAGVVDWAYSLLNLGLLLSRRDEAGDHARARDSYEQALAHLKAGDDLALWGTLQNNLADLLLSGDSPEPEAAGVAARSALAVIDGASDPVLAGRLKWMLARAEDHRGEPPSADALQLRHEAFGLLSPQIAPSLHLTVGGELFEAHARLGDWATAADVAASQLAAFGILYNAQASAEDQRRVLARIPRLGRWAAYALARAGRAGEAVEAIEHARARQLSVSATRDTADLAQLAKMDEHLAAAYRAALAARRMALDGAGATGAPFPAVARPGTAGAEREIQRLLPEIRRIPGLERFLQPPSLDDICSAADSHPVIYLVSAPWGSYALIARASAGEPTVDAIPVPEVTSTSIAHLITVSPAGAPGFFLAQAAKSAARPWLLHAAMHRLDEITPLISPVADALAGDPDNIAIVIPTGLLGLLPLAAVPVPGRPGQVLDDIGEIHLAPSASVYGASRRRAPHSAQLRLVGVADPTGPWRLPAAGAELAAIRDIFPPGSQTACAFGADATRAWVLAQIPGASHVHLACHGSSEFTSQAGGSLLLADDTRLTIADLTDGRLTGCRLATASACQSGHYSITDTPDEFTGLPPGFLQAGAACAVVSLWQVRDDATALLMTRFYELLSPGSDNASAQPARALREARTWLRHLTTHQAGQYIQGHPHLAQAANLRPSTAGSPAPPYAEPQFWAAFTAWGY